MSWLKPAQQNMSKTPENRKHNWIPVLIPPFLLQPQHVLLGHRQHAAAAAKHVDKKLAEPLLAVE
jgi:hypothetical protein